MPSDRSAERILLPDTFPQSNYTPFGYINNPYHSAVSNPSGVIRTVPPLGFGFWARKLPWPYGSVLTRPLSYLSLLHLSVYINGVRFHTVADFQAHDVRLVSQYHTQTLMSYDWEFDSITLSAKYFLADEHALVCVLELDNGADTDKTVTVHATNIYGFPDHPYWGCDGVRSVYRANDDAGVSKFWAYGEPTGGYRDRYTPHSLPETYHYRIPGVADEFWPLQVGEHSHAGAEHYGWGATFPTLVIRNIIGFREGDSLTEDRFFLAPALPVLACQSGNTYGITNLRYRESRTNVKYTLKENRKLLVHVISTLTAARSVTVMDETGRTVAQTTGPVRLADLSFEAVNGAIYTVTLT